MTWTAWSVGMNLRDRRGQKAWNEAAHPRAAAGSSAGGQFVTAQGSSAGQGARSGAQKLLKEKLTEESIRRYQRQHGLAVDGKIGRQTAASLLGDESASKLKPGSMTTTQRRQLEAVAAGKPVKKPTKRKPAKKRDRRARSKKK